MKYLLNRDEYLESKINEGFGDSIRRGFEKVKSFFSLVIRKVKNFIAIFDKNGNVLPVVSLQATIDHFSNSSDVNVYAPKEISDSVVTAGGRGCDSSAPMFSDNSSYKDVDEDSIEYKNLMSLPQIIRESYSSKKGEKINERISYSKPGEKLNIDVIDTEEFKTLLAGRIKDRHGRKHKGNLLIFGAPGIGKSTIANSVISEYNKMQSSNTDKISLITVNCANVSPGDFMMPTIPTTKDVMGYIKDNPDNANLDLSNLTDRQREKLDAVIKAQKVSDSAPKTWLPCYKKSGDPDVDDVLDAYANGAITANKNDARKNFQTGSGGIILLDELFRADPAIFHQMMNFLLDREMDGYVLGSKWAIVACSNRPADSQKVTEVFSEVNEGAVLDRFTDIALLIPDPESWKEYMRSKGLTGENEILFKFIFDPDSMEGNEYTRWHRADNKIDISDDTSDGNEHSDANTKPVTPRSWESVWTEIMDYMEDEGYKSILEIPMKELNLLLKGKFTPNFRNELIDWLESHIGNVSIDDIFADPTSVYPSKSTKGNDVVIVRDLWDQLESRYKGKDEKLSDDNLSNVIAWMGMHMPDQVNIIKDEFFENLDKIVKLDEMTKSMDVLYAGWPAKEDFEEDGILNDEKKLGYIKDIMRKYFPWRLDKDGEILWVDDYDVD